MAAVALSVIGLALSASANRKARKEAKKAEQAAKEAEKRAKEAAEFTARQYEDKAKQERAASQHEAEEVKHQAKILQSNARAIGAASGAGGYETSIADIQGAADYRMLIALYNGDRSARDLELAAEVARREGADAARAQAATAGAYRSRAETLRVQGMADTFNGALSLYERYGQPYKPETFTYDVRADQVNNSASGYQSVAGIG